MAKKKPRFGKDDSIFSSTDATKESAGKAKAAAPGRDQPKSHGEEWTKVTVVLYNREITFLDDLSVKIRKKTGTVIRRAGIIRALVDMLEDSKIDLTDVESEADIKAKLLDALK